MPGGISVRDVDVSILTFVMITLLKLLRPQAPEGEPRGCSVLDRSLR